MNILKNFKNLKINKLSKEKLDKEKLFYRLYFGIGFCFYGFVVSGLYLDNSLHKEEIENGNYEKLSHSEIQKRSLNVASGWPLVVYQLIKENI